jgi:hypothetical protein
MQVIAQQMSAPVPLGAIELWTGAKANWLPLRFRKDIAENEFMFRPTYPALIQAALNGFGSVDILT